jgi:TPR repeat protein
MYVNGEGVEKDLSEALLWYERAAEQGDANAQFMLGKMHAAGQGVEQDLPQAYVWMNMAASAGHREAQEEAKRLTTRVSPDEVFGAVFQRADGGSVSAQFLLGILYANGEGTPKDPAQSLRWWRRAAEQGHAVAQFNLAVLYANGDAGVQDFAEALRWYREAAGRGDANAQLNLGGMYLNGQGVALDRAKAWAWFSLASAQGHAEARAQRERVEAAMTPGERKAGEAELEALRRAAKPGGR